MKDRQQFVSLEHNSTKKVTVTCGLPQGSILGPLLLLLYVNDLHHASNILNPIMFAEDTNLFFSHSDIKKTKFSFFHKSSKKDNIPLRLPNLNINAFTTERETSIKFLGVWID